VNPALRLGLAFALGASSGALAQQAELKSQRVATLYVDDAWVPPHGDAVELYVRALTNGRAPVATLEAKDFVVREDEGRIAPDDVEVSLLETAKRGLAVVLVLDTSPTMREPLPEIKKAAVSLIDRVGDWDRVAVVSFAGDVKEAAGFTADRAQVRRAIDGVQAQLEPAPTRVYDGIYRAVEMLRRGADLPRRGVVIVFSDGSDGGSQHSLAEVVELAKGAGGGEARLLVYTIAYPTGFGDSGLDNLKRIAEATSAEYLRADPAVPLTSFYADVWRQLMKSYVLRVHTDLDGASHLVEVLAGDGRDERTVRYPDLGGGILRWVLLGLLGVGIAGGATFWLHARRTGYLVHAGGPERGKRIKLQRGLNRVGQHPENEVVITQDTVSRRHAEIDVEGPDVRIRDLESRNGTFVNDIAVQSARVLKPGDRVRVADVELVYQR
jgi:Mg-chelatase subunit ChlD